MFEILAQQSTATVQITVAVAPIQQTLVSMSLLTAQRWETPKEPWLTTTAAGLPPSLQQRHTLLATCAAAFATEQTSVSFPAFLATLAQEPPATLARRLQDAADSCPTPAKSAPANPASIDTLLADPAWLQQTLVQLLRKLWEEHFAAPWTQKQSMLDYIVAELNARDWPTTSVGALLRAFLRRPVPEWLASQVGGVDCGVDHVVFVPSPYLHFQAARQRESSTLWIFLWADFGVWPMRTEPVQRTEVLGPLTALAEETRLQILELLAAHQPLAAQEIIARLDVSQSTVSRHLKQLVKAGFVHERRAGGANKFYQLQAERLGEVTHGLTQLLSPEHARFVLSDARLDEPAALRPFLDREGRVTHWPVKQKGQRAVLTYLASKFTPAATYSEVEVNELLMAWHGYEDPAYLRRALIEAGALQRTANGAAYWRTEE